MDASSECKAFGPLPVGGNSRLPDFFKLMKKMVD
ncbi:hypothetical protein AvCA_32600 [Azotobacter vinelandii CA]|uniref:Uncharacterized protein n=2 Tax=Azotobacter vinelandii TaxID=354 RepID=C1DP64_AZOVD|nr:hypothetical protein Avin_32600 [Azotobacter vinelandii DJ]AGK14690.1 hypothetical protein AvCA_32600 [Azotobacter vinelandii CA]AGK21210.1 hypothetical protein AvCA6_32600 [Azotobacter vinelandii CA6]